MAAPITHLFFADKFCDKHGEIDRFQFFAGNCLPDIRHVDETIERAKYHTKNVTINEVLSEELDFWKGVKFHCFIDENRGKFCRTHIYPLENFDEDMVKSLKFLEDDILYGKLLFRQDFINFFTKYEFPVYDIKLESINKWKKLLSDYFSAQPCENSRNKFFKGMGATNNICKKAENLLTELRGKYLKQINDMIVFVENNIE